MFHVNAHFYYVIIFSEEFYDVKNRLKVTLDPDTESITWLPRDTLFHEYVLKQTESRENTSVSGEDPNKIS